MNTTLYLFIIIPIFGFLLSLLLPSNKEKALSWSAFLTVGINWLGILLFCAIWLWEGTPVLNHKGATLFMTHDYSFFIDVLFDKITAVYLVVGSLLTLLVTIYSRYYLHREPGYKRFFNTILFFYIGYNTTILGGNFETMFIGWEILGISSFLLIAFYRDRYLPVKNAIKVFSVYRIGDIGLIMAMWASHHLWHENIMFLQLEDASFISEHLTNHTLTGVFISLMIMLAAFAKSAQLPFSSWLPRAMEGPTPSSAIFYGSLSVHLGTFLMLRTFPFWENQISVRVLLVVMGIATSIITTIIARVQSSIKSQIAYASIAQIGLMFIEIALGFEVLALIHFAGNAFLRTYQLLVSPSVVSYLIREQFYNYIPQRPNTSNRLLNSVYLLSLKEWNLDAFMDYILWRPLKNTGRRLDFLTVNRLVILFAAAFIPGLVSLYFQESIPENIKIYLPAGCSMISLLMVLKSFSERHSPRMAWLLLLMNHFGLALAIGFNEHLSFYEAGFYLSGIIVAGILGYWSLSRLKKLEGNISLDGFFGHAYEHPKMALGFLLATLGIMAFPISPTFIGEDLLFSHIHEDQIILAGFTASSFVIGGIASIRIYARVFLGPHIKKYHETPYRSA